MAGIAEQVAQLKAAADKATATRHRADADVAAAEGRLADLQQELQGEFKVDTLEKAREKEKLMETALEAEADRVRGLLAQAGGQA